MRYRRLGRTGFEVSEIGHGLWGMSGWSGSEDQQSMEALQKSVDLGCNFFDTAWAYGEGKSDTFLGKLIKQNPGKRLYAASKIPPMNGQWPSRPEYSLRRSLPPRARLQIYRADPQSPATGHHRCPAISCLERRVVDGAGIPRYSRRTQKQEADSLLWAEHQPLGAGERHQGPAHRTC